MNVSLTDLHFNQELFIDCDKGHKDDEAIEREKTKDELLQEKEEIMRPKNKKKVGKKQMRIKKARLVEINKQLEQIEEGEMNDQKFWGYNEEEEGGLDYGREVLKNDPFEIMLKLPYQSFHLLRRPLFGTKTVNIQ